MNDDAVELRHVTKIFNRQKRSPNEEVTAVYDLNLRVQRGEFFTLLGPSGCGKTTTLRLIAGFEEPNTGEVYIHDKLMKHVPPYRRPVNTVFQNYALFPHMTVEQNVAFGLTVSRVPAAEKDRKTAEVLALVQLGGLGKRRPSQLSGGQQQRAALARALINRPAVLLLDEPLGALDLKLRKQMQVELKQLQDQIGTTFIYVTHDQEEALTMSDRIAVMDQGRILQVDTPLNIYENPATRFVAEFIGETNFLTAEIGSLQNGHISLLVGGEWVQLMRPEFLDAYLRRAKTQVTLTVRPEKFNMSHWSPPLPSASPAEINGHLSLTGVVSDSIYIGTDTRYKIQLHNGESVAVQLRSISQTKHGKGQVSFRNGDHVQVTCSVDDLRSFEE